MLWIKKKHFLDLKSVCWIIIVKPTEIILLFPLQADCSYGLLPLNKSKTFVALSLCRGYVWWSLILLGWEFCSSDSVAPWGGYEQNNGWWEACCLGHQHLEPTAHITYFWFCTINQQLHAPAPLNLQSHVIINLPDCQGCYQQNHHPGYWSLSKTPEGGGGGVKPGQVTSLSQGQYRDTTTSTTASTI